tara:strand:+ start:530 stop:1684 length:1155 start_codon:yes stop_codon:yes gene_type:complete
MKNVLIRGPLISSSGYGVHARQVFSYIESKECKINSQITPWGMCPYLVNREYEDGIIGRILDTGTPLESKPDISFQIQLPNEWEPGVANYNVGVTAGVETDKCSIEWVDCINKMDMVIVPSEHTKACFVNSGADESVIKVIPEYIQPSIIKEKMKPMELEVDTKFNFLIFGLITGLNPESDRKNTFYGIKWLCEAFSDDPEVGIIIKTGLGRSTTIDRSKSVEVLRKIVYSLRKGKYPKFYLSHGLMTDDEVSSFLRSDQINVLASFTRGEGYGLPLIEAAASGVPVMATNWSGHIDFLKNIKYSSFEYDLIEIDQSRVDQIFIKGSKWAHPREKEVIRKLKKIRKSYDVPKQWASEGKEVIRNSFNQGEVFKIYDKFLDDILK